jgi:hypothetical protein
MIVASIATLLVLSLALARRCWRSRTCACMGRS